MSKKLKWERRRIPAVLPDGFKIVIEADVCDLIAVHREYQLRPWLIDGPKIEAGQLWCVGHAREGLVCASGFKTRKAAMAAAPAWLAMFERCKKLSRKQKPAASDAKATKGTK